MQTLQDMSRASPYERNLAAEAMTSPLAPIEKGTALVLVPDGFQYICDVAVWPALAAVGFRPPRDCRAFDSSAWLHDAARWINGAELIVADLTGMNPEVLYMLGLCHGLGRQPLLICQDSEPSYLPFMLQSLRHIVYQDDAAGLRWLREELTRAIHVFVDSANASWKDKGA